MNEMKLTEKLKDEAFNLIKLAAEGEDITQAAVDLYEEYKSLSVRYPRGSEVWYLEGRSICKCKVISVGFNYYGHPLYRLSEVAGRTVNGGDTLPEEVIFKTKEDLVDCYKRILGL